MEDKEKPDEETAPKVEEISFEDQEKWGKVAETLFNRTSSTRTALERIWMRNILYYIGEQWIKWDKTEKTFTASFSAKQNEPTPVDNIIADHVRAVKALLINRDIDWRIWPESDDLDDQNAADIGEKVLSDQTNRNDGIARDIEEEAALCTVLTGNGFVRAFPAMDAGTTLLVPDGGKLKTGDVGEANILPFNVFPDETVGTRLRDKRMVGIQDLKHKDWVKDNFPGIDIPSGSLGEDSGINYQQALTKIVGQVSPWKSTAGVSNDSTGNDELVLFREIEVAPTAEHPKGQYIVLIGEKVVKVTDRLPIPVDKDGRWYYTLEDFRDVLVMGRFWGESSVNGLISHQNIINKIDQDLLKNRGTVGKPIAFLPNGVNLKRKSNPNDPVSIYEYDPMQARGAQPVITHGQSLPGQVFNERSTQRQAAKDASGDPQSVLRGQAPSGSSGYMFDIMKETAEAAHAPDVHRFYRALARHKRKQLIIIQEIYTEERMIKISGKDSKLGVLKFRGSDLKGNTDVRFEMAGGISSTRSGQVQAVQGLVQAGFFNPQIVDPMLRNELLKKMRITSFKDKVSSDIKRAERENQQLVNGELDFYIEAQMLKPDGTPFPMPDGSGRPMLMPNGEPPWVAVPNKDGKYDLVFDMDDHQVHGEIHREFILTPEFQELGKDAQAIMIAHYEAHMRRVAAMVQAQQDAMMAQQQLGSQK